MSVRLVFYEQHDQKSTNWKQKARNKKEVGYLSIGKLRILC